MDIFDFIDSTIIPATATTIKDLNPIALAINNFITKLAGSQLLIAYFRIKKTITNIENTVMSLRCDQAIINDFKNIISNHLRTNKATQELIKECQEEPLKKELTDLQRESTAFVIIPSVWKFKPEKLTDQQRDKMKQRRSDIPALYNDMSQSQSQESFSIKAWTPASAVAPETALRSIINESEVNKNTTSLDTNQEEVKTADPFENATDMLSTIYASPKKNSIQRKSDADLSPSKSSSKISEEEKLQIKVKNELKKIQIDIVDAKEFQEDKPRLRNGAKRQDTVVKSRRSIRRSSIDSEENSGKKRKASDFNSTNVEAFSVSSEDFSGSERSVINLIPDLKKDCMAETTSNGENNKVVHADDQQIDPDTPTKVIRCTTKVSSKNSSPIISKSQKNGTAKNDEFDESESLLTPMKKSKNKRKKEDAHLGNVNKPKLRNSLNPGKGNAKDSEKKQSNNVSVFCFNI